MTKGGSGTHELEPREYTIGRSTHADIVLADPSVSGHHAKLAPRGDAFAVSDLGSTNGTTVDGRAVQGSYVLRGGRDHRYRRRSPTLRAPHVVPWPFATRKATAHHAALTDAGRRHEKNEDAVAVITPPGG